MTDASNWHRFSIGYSVTNRVPGFLRALAVGLQLVRTILSTFTAAPGKLRRKEKVERIEHAKAIAKLPQEVTVRILGFSFALKNHQLNYSCKIVLETIRVFLRSASVSSSPDCKRVALVCSTVAAP